MSYLLPNGVPLVQDYYTSCEERVRDPYNPEVPARYPEGLCAKLDAKLKELEERFKDGIAVK